MTDKLHCESCGIETIRPVDACILCRTAAARPREVYGEMRIIPGTGDLFPKVAMPVLVEHWPPEDVRRAYLVIAPGAVGLTPETRDDYIAGRCELREYQGIPIIDYTRPIA